MSFEISLCHPFENYCESDRMKVHSKRRGFGGGGGGGGGILNSSSLLEN